MENFEEKIMQPQPSEEENKIDVPEPAQQEVVPEDKEPEVVDQPILEKPTESVEEETEDKYSPEAIAEEIKFKAEKIKNWAQQAGLSEGKDFLIIENIKEVEKDTDSIAPHEMKQFFVGIHEDQYRKFKDYFTGKYKEERKLENPKGDVKLDYSWGGRFLVGWDGVPFDTVAVSDMESLTVPTHHKEFQEFFKQKAGFDFPSSEVLNPIIKDMSGNGLATYESALQKLREMRDQETLPGDGYGLIDSMEHSIMILKDAQTGEAVIDLPETLQGEMPAKMRHYADLTYNAEDIRNLDRVAEITGTVIPEEVRIDRIFSRFGFDRQNMESICRDFSEYIMLKRELAKNLPPSSAEPKEKPEFLFHGTDNPNINEFEPRKRLIPGGTGRDVPARVYAGDNPAFASAFSFPWSDKEGFELSFDKNGLVIFRVPINEKHRLQQKVYLYKIASKGFEPTEGEGTGHSYHIEKKVTPQECITFNNAEEAIINFGGIVEYYDPDAEAKAKKEDETKIAETRNSLGLK